jgi:hypothetical protein
MANFGGSYRGNYLYVYFLDTGTSLWAPAHKLLTILHEAMWLNLAPQKKKERKERSVHVSMVIQSKLTLRSFYKEYFTRLPSFTVLHHNKFPCEPVERHS